MILSYYYNNGFPDAAFDWTQTPGEGAHRVNLKYTLNAGKRVYVRSVLLRDRTCPLSRNSSREKSCGFSAPTSIR